MPDRADPPTQPASRSSAPSGPSGRAAVAGGIALAVVFGAVAAGLLALALAARGAGTGTAAGTSVPQSTSFAFAEPLPAPPLELTDQDGRPFVLDALRGRPVLVFFGYTHCPDVCPTTVGTVNEVLAATGDGPRAVFVSIDPERDDVAAMASYLRYLPAAYAGLTGTPREIADTALRWGVRYARVDQASAAGYAMAHTADLFLVDAQGRLRARFPFGTPAGPMIELVGSLLAETPPAAAIPVTSAPEPTRAPGTGAAGSPGTTAAAPIVTLLPEVVSSSIWAGPPDPVILRVADSSGRRLDGSAPVSVQLARFDGTPEGPPVAASAIRPVGERQVSFVAPVAVPAPGAWRLVVSSGGIRGDIPIQVLDPGATAPIGGPAPAIDTPTLEDVGGVVRAVTTQPQPDLRMSRTSTSDALAAGKPYVIVIDSARFKVSPECGRALTMVRYLLDRWEDEVVFVHLEPFEYRIITEEPVLSGPLTDPPLNVHARAFGLGDAAWPATRMPWIFVVDARGTVRAKYTGIVGSADIDVILSQVTGRVETPH